MTAQLGEHTHVRIRRAEPADFAAVSALLLEAKLPIDGLDEQFGPAYAVAESAGRVVGAQGIEQYDGAGLLRSAVVDFAFRGHGIGEDLTHNRLEWARNAGLAEVWLLTTTAAEWFPRFGFARANRADAPDALQQSREFREACPASAVAMRLDLAQGV